MKGFIKRFLPFFATFALGLLVASFFVSVSAPNFKFKRNWKHREYHRLKYENKCLKAKNERLRRELEAQRFQESSDYMNLEVPPPPVPPMPPAPPRPPIAPKRIN